MISELVNALFLTFVATEYQLSAGAVATFPARPPAALLLRPRILAAAGVVLLVNVLDRVSGAAAVADRLLQGLWHVPRVVVAAAAYALALYLDCRRLQPQLATRRFLGVLSVAFLRVLPLYPVLAVAVSFGFLLLINLFELLRLPLALLNQPIYYGTLYGPFSLIYLRVKRRVVEERHRLPKAVGVGPTGGG